MRHVTVTFERTRREFALWANTTFPLIHSAPWCARRSTANVATSLERILTTPRYDSVQRNNVIAPSSEPVAAGAACEVLDAALSER